jgi:hypothetical protein
MWEVAGSRKLHKAKNLSTNVETPAPGFSPARAALRHPSAALKGGATPFDFLLPKLRLRVNLKLLKREMKSEENGGCR